MTMEEAVTEVSEQSVQQPTHQPMLYAPHDESLRKEAVSMGLDKTCAKDGGLCTHFAGFIRNGPKPGKVVWLASLTVKLVVCGKHPKPRLINDAAKCPFAHCNPVSPT